MSDDRSTTKITTGGTISMLDSISSVPVEEAQEGRDREIRRDPKMLII
jgi:hypothetical protein